MDNVDINSRELRAIIARLFENLRSNEVSLQDFASAVTHLNFDPRFSEELSTADPGLSEIIEDLAPDIEVEPEFASEKLERIRRLLALDAIKKVP